jgi:hypothetical protein
MWLQRHSGRNALVRIAMLAAFGLAPCAYADSAFDGMSASPVWGNFQWGLVAIQRSTVAMDNVDSHDTYWRLEGGMRMARDWLVGVGTQRISLNSIEKLSQVYGTAIFNPGRGPWLYQAGLGSARYAFASGSFFEEKHQGLAVDLGVGRDWSPGGIDDVHLGVRLVYEYSRLGAADNGPGSFNHSRLSLGFSASFY